VAVLPAAYVAVFELPRSREKGSIAASTALSAVGFAATLKLIPVVARANERKNLFGRDINKRGTPAGEVPIPESLGLATGLVHIICIVLFQQIHTYFLRDPAQASAALSHGRGGHHHHVIDDWTEKWLIQYNSALASISLMVFLGFADDVLDIPWRVKLFLPFAATLPILAAYTGSTAVLVPKAFEPLVRSLAQLVQTYVPACVQNVGLTGVVLHPGGTGAIHLLELGPIYQVFMLLVVVFCTNSINILAGLNGLEAGQTLVISGAVLLHNVLSLSEVVSDLGSQGAVSAQVTADLVAKRDAQLFSVYITLPLIAVTAALLLFNYYPSKVFVGDTYTYFAGMALAVAGILGHFSETLLVFFAPQIINFLYSTPQLFKVVPCPRHRLPVYDKRTGLLHPSRREDGGWNLNLVTLFLRLFGPATERQLCNRILAFQVLCCALGFAASRYLL